MECPGVHGTGEDSPNETQECRLCPPLQKSAAGRAAPRNIPAQGAIETSPDADPPQAGLTTLRRMPLGTRSRPEHPRGHRKPWESPSAGSRDRALDAGQARPEAPYRPGEACARAWPPGVPASVTEDCDSGCADREEGPDLIFGNGIFGQRRSRNAWTGLPYRRAKAWSSMTSTRRSPLSLFETKAWLLRSRRAASTCWPSSTAPESAGKQGCAWSPSAQPRGFLPIQNIRLSNI